MKYSILVLSCILVQYLVDVNFCLVSNVLGPGLTIQKWYFHTPANDRKDYERRKVRNSPQTDRQLGRQQIKLINMKNKSQK